MSFISTKPLRRYPWLIRLFFWKQKRTYGKILEPGLLWGRSPWIFATLALLYGAFNRRNSPLTPALRSLITVRVSQINHCAFCVDINSATLLKRGVSLEKVEALAEWRATDLFSDDERLALEYAEVMTISGHGVDDDLRAKLKAKWSDDEIVELTGLVAFQNLSSKFNSALEPIQEVVESDESFVIPYVAPECGWRGAQCGNQSIAMRRAVMACVIPAI